MEENSLRFDDWFSYRQKVRAIVQIIKVNELNERRNQFVAFVSEFVRNKQKLLGMRDWTAIYKRELDAELIQQMVQRGREKTLKQKMWTQLVKHLLKIPRRRDLILKKQNSKAKNSLFQRMIKTVLLNPESLHNRSRFLVTRIKILKAKHALKQFQRVKADLDREKVRR